MSSILNKYTLSAAVATLTMAACSDSDLANNNGGDDNGGNTGQNFTLSVPISIDVSNPYYDPSGTRAATNPGDPGVEELLPPPGNLYWVSVLRIASGSYRLTYGMLEDLDTNVKDGVGSSSNNDWTYNPDELDKNSPSIRYKLTKNITLNYGAYSPYTPGDGESQELGRTYVFATPKGRKIGGGNAPDAFKNLIGSWFASTETDDNNRVHAVINNQSLSVNSNQSISNDIDKFKDLMTVAYVPTAADAQVTFTNGKTGYNDDKMVWTTNGSTSTAWAPYEYRDLYSTPYRTMDGTDKNACIMYTSSGVKHNDIKLYHCAAKYDFQWEVAEDLRNEYDGVWLDGITVNTLPTVCNIFDPTHNPADSDIPSSTTNGSVDVNIITTGAEQTVNNAIVQYDLLGRQNYYKEYPKYLDEEKTVIDTDNAAIDYYTPKDECRDSIFIGRTYNYGLLPARSNGNVTVPYSVSRYNRYTYHEEVSDQQEAQGDENSIRYVFDYDYQPSVAKNPNYGQRYLAKGTKAWYWYGMRRTYYATWDYSLTDSEGNKGKDKTDTTPRYISVDNFYQHNQVNEHQSSFAPPSDTYVPWIRFRAAINSKYTPDDYNPGDIDPL